MANNNVDDEEEWQYSYAKKLLTEDLLSGKIPLDSESMTPQEAYLQRPEYADSDPNYKRFPNRLRALREQLLAKNDRADADREAFLHDRKLHPKPARNHRGELRWEGSEAERLLRLDIALFRFFAQKCFWRMSQSNRKNKRENKKGKGNKL